jgi:hypothetical protein
MPLTYVTKKEQLPTDSDFECPICLDIIDIDEVKNSQLNCVICINGHRFHNICFKKTGRHACPTCGSTDIRFCKSNLGYSYRKGGKKRKTYKKRKICKKRKTKNNRCFLRLWTF